MITLGSKMLTMEFKNWVLQYLEGKLDLRVDKMKMAIHSAVFENISFLEWNYRWFHLQFCILS